MAGARVDAVSPVGLGGMVKTFRVVMAAKPTSTHMIESKKEASRQDAGARMQDSVKRNGRVAEEVAAVGTSKEKGTSLERRITPRSSKKRALLLDATEKILLEEGYAAVTSRNVALGAGMAPPLLHYYFPTLDDLFVAVLRRMAAKMLDQFAGALASPRPLRSLWELSIDPDSTAIVLEMAAAANHRKVLRAEMSEMSEQSRRMHIEAFTSLLATYDIDTEVFPPELITVALAGIARLLVNEQSLGIRTGHEEALEALDRLFQRVEDGRRQPVPQTSAANH